MSQEAVRTRAIQIIKHSAHILPHTQVGLAQRLVPEWGNLTIRTIRLRPLA